MKKRIGFVSNSSSSSFIAMADQEGYNTLIRNFEGKDIEKKILEIYSEPVKFGDIQLYTIEITSGEAFEGTKAYDEIEEYKEELKEKAYCEKNNPNQEEELEDEDEDIESTIEDMVEDAKENVESLIHDLIKIQSDHFKHITTIEMWQ